MTGTTTSKSKGKEVEESIYNLISKSKINECKKEQYRSKHNPNAPLVGSTFGLHGTTEIMGKGVHELKKVSVLMFSSHSWFPSMHLNIIELL